MEKTVCERKAVIGLDAFHRNAAALKLNNGFLRKVGGGAGSALLIGSEEAQAPCGLLRAENTGLSNVRSIA